MRNRPRNIRPDQMTPAEAAARLQVSLPTISRYLRTGRLPHSLRSNQYVILQRADVEALAKQIEPTRKPRIADRQAIEAAPVVTRHHLNSKFTGLSPRIKDAILLMLRGFNRKEACRRAGIGVSALTSVIRESPRQVAAYRREIEPMVREAEAHAAAYAALLRWAPAEEGEAEP